MIPRKGRTKAKLKYRIICKKCFKVFINQETKINIKCPFCKCSIDARDRVGYAKEYLNKHPERLKQVIKYDKEHKKERGRKWRIRLRKVVFNIISHNNPVCENCGCDDFRLLEINHKNGGGTKDLGRYGRRTNQFVWDIYKGIRKIDDLNLLCRVCNAKHYLELKYGRLPYVIKYNSL